MANSDTIAPAPAVFRYEIPQVRKLPLWSLGGIVFVLFAVVLLVALRGTAAGVSLGLSFVAIVLEALPFVMLGSLLGGLFEVFVPREWIVRMLPRRKIFAVLVAASLGLLLPVCECAVIPFTRRLVRKGVPFSTAVAYLLAGPIVNVLVGSATLMAYGFNWHILAARMVFGYVVAVAVALVIDRWFPGHSALLDPTMSLSCATTCDCGHDHDDEHEHHHDHEEDHAGCCDNHEQEHEHNHEHHHEHEHEHPHDHEHEHNHDHAEESGGQPLWKRFADAINHAGDDFLSVGQFLVIGALIASICQTVIPRHAFLTVAHAPAVAILLMMGLAVALNLCSGADAFVAASFRAVLPLSAQMGFMVLGPMLDLKLSAMYLSFIRKRTFIAMVILMYAFVFGLMMAYQYFFVAGMR